MTDRTANGMHDLCHRQSEKVIPFLTFVVSFSPNSLERNQKKNEVVLHKTSES